MLGLAGIPATAGFIGKFYLIDAAVDGDYAWLGIVIVIGSMISMAYYLRVVSAMWLSDAPSGSLAPSGPLPALAGGSPDAPGEYTPDGRSHWEVALVAVVFGAATIVLGVIPGPLFDLVRDSGTGLGLF
jgi:NADH-quinone oxidoreductase subunit N